MNIQGRKKAVRNQNKQIRLKSSKKLVLLQTTSTTLLAMFSSEDRKSFPSHERVKNAQLPIQTGPGIFLIMHWRSQSMYVSSPLLLALLVPITSGLLLTASAPISSSTPCQAGPQPQARYRWRRPPLPVLIHFVDCKIVGPGNYPKRIFAQLQIFGVNFANI